MTPCPPFLPPACHTHTAIDDKIQMEQTPRRVLAGMRWVGDECTEEVGLSGRLLTDCLTASAEAARSIPGSGGAASIRAERLGVLLP